MSHEETLSVLQAVYTRLNGRATNALQKHEVLLLSSESEFDAVATEIASEIVALENDHTALLSGENYLCQDVHGFIASRGYDVPTDIGEDAAREQTLYSLLVDLQCARLQRQRSLRSSLDTLTGEGGSAMQQVSSCMSQIAQLCGFPSAAPISSYLEMLRQRPLPPPSGNLLCPTWHFSIPETERLLQIMDDFNSEYSVRRAVLARRLDVTIQAFLRSANAEKNLAGINRLIADCRWKNESRSVGMWHLLKADGSIFDVDKVSSRYAVRSVVKTIVIGHVPDRGGVPEGYTVEDIGKDVTKANVLLSAKDAQGGAKVQTTIKRWTGQGMGVGGDAQGGKDAKGKDKGGKDRGRGKEKGGGYDYRPGSRNPSPQEKSSSLGYYGNKNSGGSYYDSQGGGKGSSGGGGGYYDSKGGSSSSGSGYYDSKGSSGGGGGGGYYNNKGGGGGGGGGGFGGRPQDRAKTSKGWKKGK
ncbi:unnamed protein product [Amoebophrya sp. A25]|nr:unnamed protein product [Amoebophrya sp. A25]|eukprot:GSA25T00000770001.1